MIVINNCPTSNPQHDIINSESKRLNLNLLDMKGDLSGPSSKNHAKCLNKAFPLVFGLCETENDVLVFLDFDAFLINYWDVQKDIPFGKMRTVVQIRSNKKYPWPNFMMFRPKTISKLIQNIDWMPGTYDNGVGYDTGGKVANFIEEKVFEIESIPFMIDDINEKCQTSQKIFPQEIFNIIKPYQFQLINNNILHCRNGSQWTGNAIHIYGQLANKCRLSEIEKVLFDLLENKWKLNI